MTVFEAVVLRLAMLGYEVTEEDTPAINYVTEKCRAELLADINQKAVPDGLFYTLVDMVAGSFLKSKLGAGALEIEGLDFSPAVKSVTEGDISVTVSEASEGTLTPEARFIAALDGMTHPAESVLGAFRRLKW